MICSKHNAQGRLRPKPGKFPEATYPFQCICMDFIELNRAEGKKYCLVIIDMFSKWVEITPTVNNDAITVAINLQSYSNSSKVWFSREDLLR